MRIRQMTATFGRLDCQTLRLESGMNRIIAPNEWGKSTWCAFLTAMFYGIDTRERSGKDSLADKERYAPWSGKPMEGIIHLEHEGRNITIQRRTKGRTPMGDFLAYDSDTGVPIRELTADNCGQKLLGVERSVFRRTGFIRLQEMPVVQDETLRRRLNSLVTTGDESGAADRLAEKLKDLKNRCQYHRGGLIPQTRQRMDQLREQLRQRQSLDERLGELDRLEQKTVDYVNQLELHQSWLTYYDSQQSEDRLIEAQTAERKARERLEQAKNRCKNHPPRQDLQELLNLPVAAVGETRIEGLFWMLLSILALLCGLLLLMEGEWTYAAATLIVSAILACVCLALRSMQQDRMLKQRREREAKRQRWLDAMEDWDDLEQLRQEVARAKQHTEAIRELTRTADMPDQSDPMDLIPEQTRRQWQEAVDRLGRYRQQRGECLGRMDHLPQTQELQRQMEQTQSRMRELELTYNALEYALKALEEAKAQLQSRYAPRITHRAEQLLSELTGGRYDRLGVDTELALSAAARDEVALRGTLWRSDGTVDQMYLALRLAVWEELMPEGILVLDDALVRFDQQRLDAAMELLERIAQKNQVIVFMCR